MALGMFPQPRSRQTLGQRAGGPVMSASSTRAPGGYGMDPRGVQPVPWGTSGGGGGDERFPTPSSGGASYSAQLDPNIKSVYDTMMERFKQGYSTNANLSDRLSDDTTQSLINRATGQISDEARGMEGRAAAIEAKGGPAANARAIQEAAARRSAGVTTDIVNDRAKAKDALAVTDAGLESTWAQGQNSVLGAAGGMATAGAQNQLNQILAQQGAQQGAWSNLQQVLAMSMANGGGPATPAYLPRTSGGFIGRR